MERGNLSVKMIELPVRFARRLLQGSILCTMVIVIFLFIIILFDAMFQIQHQKLDFLSFVYHSSLLRTCHWTEVHCGGAELGASC